MWTPASHGKGEGCCRASEDAPEASERSHWFLHEKWENHSAYIVHEMPQEEAHSGGEQPYPTAFCLIYKDDSPCN